MKVGKLDRRKLLVVGTALALSGCKLIPGGATVEPTPEPLPTPEPSATGLPSDDSRHRVALLVPMSGTNAGVGQSIANATTMAILDTNAGNLRITTYDTAGGARAAAAKAVAEGNKLILGPLMGDQVPQVLSEARPANVPIITFSNDAAVAAADVFVMGQVPEQSVTRTVSWAKAHGSNSFAVIVPEGEYGQKVAAAFQSAVGSNGGRFVGSESYARGNTSIVSASERLKQRGGFDTVLIAEGARLAVQSASVFRPRGVGAVKLLGTELWSGESEITRNAALRGAWFSAVSDARYRRFSDSYGNRFGGQPYRISTLGYDAVLLTLRVARDWKVGRSFPTRELYDAGGFLGLDGPFRFGRNGVVERAMEVREVRDGAVVIADPAPTKF